YDIVSVPTVDSADTIHSTYMVSYSQKTSSSTADFYRQYSSLQFSDLNPDLFEHWLQGYDVFEKEQLLFNLRNGIVIPSTKQPPNSYHCFNHKSALDNPKEVQRHIDEGIKKGIISGPFDSPTVNLIISPLALVPKKDSAKMRLIHNLSYPKKDSVNSHIDRDFCTVQYELIDKCIELVFSLGKNCLMAKADILSAFNILSIHPNSIHFLGFT
ncbi:MAG: hypothetical protein GY705_06155, partial [Bacteroidetes bacterium]|nr:hypothetical protein [Bacteroidota bacterium]